MCLVGPREIVGKAASAGQKPVVLNTLDVLSLAEYRHTLLLSSRPSRERADYNGEVASDKPARRKVSPARRAAKGLK